MRFSSFTYLVGQGLHSMRANRLMTFASMGVLTVCMVLVGAAFLFGVNIEAIVDYIGEQNMTMVYVQNDATDEQAAALGDAIEAVPGVASITYYSSQDILSQYDDMLSAYTSLQEVFADDNPFQRCYEVVVTDVSQIESILPQLQALEYVDDVSAPVDMSRLFVSLQNVVNYVCYGLVAVLALVSIVVINNTIRITVFARRKEIAIMKLVGATNGFIRFPFFVEGTTSGLLSAAISSGIVCGAYAGILKTRPTSPQCLAVRWFRLRMCGISS